MKILFASFGAVILLVGALLVFQEMRQETEEPFEGLRVGASFYSLAEFAERVGGERASVQNFTPTGVEPHDYEPTPRELQALYDLDVFLFVGAGFDPWAERLEDDLKGKGVRVLKMAEIVEFLELEGGKDPHFWLDPVLVIAAVDAIQDALGELDQENRREYAANARTSIAELEELHGAYEEGLATCERREIIVAHDAFSYLGERYNITIHPIAGISPHEEPTPRRMGELARLAQERGIPYIFFETLASPRLAETIAREAGAETLVLNPIEGLTPEEKAKDTDYLRIMEENLEALKLALSCE